MTTVSKYASPLLIMLSSCTAVSEQSMSKAPPVAQVGVAFDREAEVAKFAEGLADPQSGRAITPDDPARVASITKLIVAIGVMRLVDEGRLDLDSDVSGRLGWTLRNPAFPERPISLRMLLSHTSSIRDGISYWNFPLGASVQNAMTDPKAWDDSHPPAGYFTYSNLNYPIIAALVEAATGERFDVWMRNEILEPMKLDACFNWETCSDETISRAVVLTQDGKAVRDDLRGKRPDCSVLPTEDGSCDLSQWRAGENGALFSPQGGLRISVRDLARVGRMLLSGGSLDGVLILSPQSVEAMLTPVWQFDGKNGQTSNGFYCSYGLATQQIPNQVQGCDDDPVGDGVVRVGHAGDAYGLRSGLWIDRTRGTGVAYFVTGLASIPAPGRSAYRAAEEEVFRRSLSVLANQ